MVEELPPQVRKSFSYEDAELWMDIYNVSCIELKEKYSSKELMETAYTLAWEQMESAKSSRFFKAQVVVEDEDVQGETPIISEYLKIAKSDMISDGGVGIDKHSSRNVWTVWDVYEATDNLGRPAIVIKGNFFRDKPMFDAAWDIFLRGRSQFSLGSYTRRNRVCDNHYNCIIEVVPEQWFEISIVDVGASPNTGVIDIHIPEGEGEFNPKNRIEGTILSLKEGEEFCPIHFGYKGLKDELSEIMVDFNEPWDITWIHDFGAIFTGYETHTIDLDDTIDKWSEGIFATSRRLHVDADLDEYIRFLIPYSYFTPLDETDIAILIIDEEDAIVQYDHAIEQAKRLGKMSSSAVVGALEHIRDEEIEHIQELYDIVYNFYLPNPNLEPSEVDEYPDKLTLKNQPGEMEGVTQCPAGQHSHTGVTGCHDITRQHDFERGSAPEGKIDVTDEFIDVDAIKSSNTPHLSEVVKTIAKALTAFSNDEVRAFMESTGGKEFALMLTELVDRKRESKGSDKMDEEVKTDKKVSEKMDTDAASELSSLITVIADIQSKVEHLTTLVMDAKSSAMEGTSQSGDIADAVNTAVESISDSDGVDLGETSVGNADGTSSVSGSNESEGGGEGDGPEEGFVPEEGEDGGESDGGEPEEVAEEESEEGEPEGDGDGGDEKEDEPEEDEGDEEGEEDKTKDKTKESVGISDVDADPTDKTEDDEKEEVVKKDDPEVKEKADASEIPSVPSEVPGIVEGTPNIGGDGNVIGGPEGVDAQSSPAPSDEMVSTKGVTVEEEVPPTIEKGPIANTLEEVSKTQAVDSFEATTETGLEGWVALSKSFLGEGVSMKVDDNPLETKISLKSTDAGVVIIPPAEVTEGTGLNLDKPMGQTREYEKLWGVIGSDNKTFSKVRKEVLE